MASFCYIFVYSVVFLLVSTVIASASTNRTSVAGSVLPSLEIGGLTDGTFKCDPEIGIYTTDVWPPAALCTVCLTYCRGSLAAIGTRFLNMKCSHLPPTGKMKCECCVKKPTPPPAPPCSPPAPSGGQCETGDTYTETTMPTSNCADCTNWCKEDCAGLGGRVTDDKCAIGESKFIRRCKCCCRGGNSGPKLF
ncbi:uncharacterized protein LOC113325978 [Papaver somniferum]|uniref:uncharacterized protein LOC113325978 n=1 Tax=Papaver somniferum TaxID=3469 RepID=UPI000E6FB6BE|nr:uncharacterized protein LOC113325978 [Papaver somniferum]